MGTALFLIAQGGGAGDPLVVGVISGLLGGGLLSGIAALIRGRSGAQLDVSGAAKVLFDELRAERDELRTERNELRGRVDELENSVAEMRRQHEVQIEQLRAKHEQDIQNLRRELRRG